MIRGNNELRLNGTTINAAIEYWLNNVVMKEPINVVSVVEDRTNGYVFIVKLSDNEAAAKIKLAATLEIKP